MNDADVYQPPLAREVVPASGPELEVRGFAKGWIITDLVFSGLRLPIAALGVVGLNNPQLATGIAATAIYEVLANFLIAAFGVLAAVLLLRGRKAGIRFGWCALGAVAFSFAITLWQLLLMVQAQAGTAEAAGMVVGGAFSLLVRLGLNVVYAIVLVRLGRPRAA